MLSALARHLEPHLAVQLIGDDADVRGVHRDSRTVGLGDLFAALPGATVDGARFTAGAVEAGAVAVLAEARVDLDVPLLVVSDARRAMALAAHEIYGQPTHSLEVIGITGTNGKTTTAWLIDEMLRGLGASPALLGTVAHDGGASPAGFTTPEADDLARFAEQAVRGGASHLVMEVSSHGLQQRRVTGVRFAVAAFTNLSQDHLDFHGTMDAYGEAKARLFVEFAPQTSVVNIDDAFGLLLAERVAEAGHQVLRCSARGPADLQALDVTSKREGIAARVRFGDLDLALRSPLVGHHNVENLLVAIGVAIALGYDVADAIAALSDAVGAPGRLERVDHPRSVAVFVDYAHTPDALTHALAALALITDGRLIVVFGCGGDRDRDKRPKMGRAACAADMVVVTSDNPRTEDPQSIVDATVQGVRDGGMSPRTSGRGFVAMVDRRDAIEFALRAAAPGDTVLIAGKGHEDYQIIGTEKRPFDDRVVAREVIASIAGEDA